MPDLWAAVFALMISAMICSWIFEGTMAFWDTERWWLYPSGGAIGILIMTLHDLM